MLADGAAEIASARLREALTLWRGPPLSEFAYEEFAQREIARLEELSSQVLEERIEADLALGRHADLVGELEALVSRAAPPRAAASQLMLALYRVAGRRRRSRRTRMCAGCSSMIWGWSPARTCRIWSRRSSGTIRRWRRRRASNPRSQTRLAAIVPPSCGDADRRSSWSEPYSSVQASRLQPSSSHAGRSSGGAGHRELRGGA